MREQFTATMLPYCLAMGISEAMFWDMNITRLRPYFQARNILLEEKNYIAWLSGFYVYNATSVALANAFRKPGSKIEKYIEEPPRITPLTEDEKLAKAQNEREKAIALFNAMIKADKAKTTPVKG